MTTEEREFPDRIPNALGFSLLISLERAVHLHFPSSAAVSWFKQLLRPTLETAASRGCLGSTGLLAPTPVPLPERDGAMGCGSGWRDGAALRQAITRSSCTLCSLVQRCLLSSFFFLPFFLFFFLFLFCPFFFLSIGCLD